MKLGWIPLLSGLVSASASLEKLKKLSSSSTPIKFTSPMYDEFTAGPRDYSLSILLTALGPQFKCIPCANFDPEHKELARQWTRKAQQPETPHFFAVLDFRDGQDTFRKLGLQSAPSVQFFPSNNAAPESYDFRLGFTAESFASWLLSRLPDTRFTYSKPIDYGRFFSAAFAVVLVSSAVYRHWARVAPFLLGRYLWAAGSLAVILLMISGRMWVQIRTAPFAVPNGVIAGGYQNQYGIEVYIVAGIYAVLGIAVYTLADVIPKHPNASTQRLGIYIWTVIIILVHSLLLRIFRLKNGGYPFTFLL